MKLRNNHSAVLPWLLGAALAGVMLCWNGCTTVTPPVVHPTAPSWDGMAQNSGFLGWTTNGCALLTPHARDRYNALALVYGRRFAPAIGVDYGVTATTSNVFLLTPEALAKFAAMNRWRKTDAVKP